MKCEYLLVVLWRLLSNPTSPLKRALAAYRRIDLSAPCPKPVTRRVHRTIHRLTSAEIDDAIAGYQAGATTRQLGRTFGVDRRTVARALVVRGVQLRGMPMTPYEAEEAAKLYARGLSLAQVANEIGYNASTVHLKLKAAGVKMRGPHGRLKGAFRD